MGHFSINLIVWNNKLDVKKRRKTVRDAHNYLKIFSRKRQAYTIFQSEPIIKSHLEKILLVSFIRFSSLNFELFHSASPRNIATHGNVFSHLFP